MPQRIRRDGTHPLLASGDNRLVEDGGNNHFSDVLRLDKLSDYLFGIGFESAQ